MSDQSKFPGNTILTAIILVIAAAAFVNTTKTIIEDGQSTRAQVMMVSETVYDLQKQIAELTGAVKAGARVGAPAPAAAAGTASPSAEAAPGKSAAKKM